MINSLCKVDPTAFQVETFAAGETVFEEGDCDRTIMLKEAAEKAKADAEEAREAREEEEAAAAEELAASTLRAQSRHSRHGHSRHGRHSSMSASPATPAPSPRAPVSVPTEGGGSGDSMPTMTLTGDAPSRMKLYIVVVGSVQVSTANDGVVATKGTHDCFGETALQDSAPRNATIRASPVSESDKAKAEYDGMLICLTLTKDAYDQCFFQHALMEKESKLLMLKSMEMFQNVSGKELEKLCHKVGWRSSRRRLHPHFPQLTAVTNPCPLQPQPFAYHLHHLHLVFRLSSAGTLHGRT
jgi:CRP-like cAMP-binding protein